MLVVLSRGGIAYMITNVLRGIEMGTALARFCIL